MFGQWKIAVAAAGIIVLGTACSSSGKPSAAPGGQSSAAGSSAAAGPTSPAAGATTPAVSSPAGSGSGGCKLSASEVTATVGVTVQEGAGSGPNCTYVTADGTGGVSIISAPVASGDEAAAISTLKQQFSDLKPIPGEQHAYSIDSVGEVIYFANAQEIIIGSSNLDDSKALALAKLVAG